MRALRWLWVSLLVGCSPVVSAPRRARVERPLRPTCQVLEGALWCADEQAPLEPVHLPFAIKMAAPRAAGGAYALGSAGQLVRIGPRGLITGAFQTELVSLTTTQDYLCGVSTGGEVLCARDHHQDAVCPAAGLSPWQRVPNLRPRDAELWSADAGKRLCTTDESGEEQCRSGRAACGRFCLSYPACGPLRCVDACAPEDQLGAML
ncbi:MAG: hypothetical protein QM778_02075 [Myxococcales bacterium]